MLGLFLELVEIMLVLFELLVVGFGLRFVKGGEGPSCRAGHWPCALGFGSSPRSPFDWTWSRRLGERLLESSPVTAAKAASTAAVAAAQLIHDSSASRPLP